MNAMGLYASEIILCAAAVVPTLAFTTPGLHYHRAPIPRRFAASAAADADDGNAELPPESKELFDGITGDLFGAGTNPFASKLEDARSSIYGLYNDDELMNVLSLHEELNDDDIDASMPQYDADDQNDFPSLHDLITGAIGEGSPPPTDFSPSNELRTVGFELDAEARSRVRKIRAIASDVDGTLLSSRQTLHPRTRMAVKRALQLAKENDDFFFFPATGKTRKGALDSLGIEIGTLIATENVPGVYIQGLYCVDGHGNVLFERKLTAAAIAGAEQLAKESGISIVAYDGDDIYTTEISAIVQDLHDTYGEPQAKFLPGSGESALNLATHEPRMHKLILMHDDAEYLSTTVRPKLEAIADECDACVTMALPTMLEWLPKGCSKAVGVAKVCEALSIDVGTELLAVGDAENDAEMLRQASVGVAVGNACPAARAAADYVLEDTNDDGGAGTAMEVFGFAGR